MKKKIEIFGEFTNKFDSLRKKAKKVKEYLDFTVLKVRYKGYDFRIYENFYDPSVQSFDLILKVKSYYDNNGELKSWDMAAPKAIDNDGEIFLMQYSFVMEFEKNGDTVFLTGTPENHLIIPELVFLKWSYDLSFLIPYEELADIMFGNLSYGMWLEFIEKLGKSTKKD